MSSSRLLGAGALSAHLVGSHRDIFSSAYRDDAALLDECTRSVGEVYPAYVVPRFLGSQSPDLADPTIVGVGILRGVWFEAPDLWGGGAMHCACSVVPVTGVREFHLDDEHNLDNELMSA